MDFDPSFNFYAFDSACPWSFSSQILTEQELQYTLLTPDHPWQEDVAVVSREQPEFFATPEQLMLNHSMFVPPLVEAVEDAEESSASADQEGQVSQELFMQTMSIFETEDAEAGPVTC